MVLPTVNEALGASSRGGRRVFLPRRRRDESLSARFARSLAFAAPTCRACVQPSEIGDLERAGSHSAFTLVSPLFTGYQTSPYYRARGAWMRPKQVGAFSSSRDTRPAAAPINASGTMENARLKTGSDAVTVSEFSITPVARNASKSVGHHEGCAARDGGG